MRRVVAGLCRGAKDLNREARPGPHHASQASQTRQALPARARSCPHQGDSTAGAGRRTPQPRAAGRRAGRQYRWSSGSGERAEPQSGGSVRYDRIVAFDLGEHDPDGVLKLDRGPHPPWYCETLPVKCRSWPRRAAPSWRPSYGESQSLIIREPRAARSRS